jgi:Domain of unknown function (DUF1996)
MMRFFRDPQITATDIIATARFDRRMIGIVVIGFAFFAAASTRAQDLAPSADAYVRGGAYAAQNAGRSTSLIVKNSQYAAYDRWSYLRFDLGTVQGPVDKAVLVLSVRSLDGPGIVEVDAASDRWSETTIRSNRRPAHGQSLSTFKVSRVGEVVVDVTGYVRAELRGDRQASFVLQAPVANERYLSFHSRESGKTPLLLIDGVRVSRSTAISVRTATQQAAATAPAEPWTACGNEGETCTVPGADNQARQIRFGTGNDYVYRTIFLASNNGSLRCMAFAFNGVDPAPGRTKHCDYGPTLVTQLPAPINPMGPAIDRSAIPVGDPGTAQQLAKPTSESAGPTDGTGAFRTVCMFSHMNFDDPIVYPGQPGRSHLHTYFGNTSANASSTRQSIETTGNSTCRGGILNRSAYWVPALIDTRSGHPVAPTENTIYYKTGYTGVPAALVQVPPAGLRMIAGDMTASSKQPIPMGWWCSDVSYPMSDAIPANCTAGHDLVMVLGFPQCWDGVNLDSPNHKSHMAYPTGNTANGCPASHPVPVPEITYNVHYPVHETGETAYWRLSSDMYGTSTPGGFSAHGDWMNGWQPEAIRAFVVNCDNRPADCHAHLLGDGREIYFDPSQHQVEPDPLQARDVKLRRR